MNTSEACSYNASTCYFIDDEGKCLSDSTVLDLILKFIVPKYYEWICIILYVIVFLVGTIGNLLVIIVIQRNRSMRYCSRYKTKHTDGERKRARLNDD